MIAPLLLAAASLLAPGAPTEARFAPATGLRVTPVARDLAAPLFVTAPPGDARLFVLEQPGRIRIVHAGEVLPAAFLDLADSVSYGGERGLLGLAFHPKFAENGLFYVNYTDRNGDTRVVRYHAPPGADRADAASAQLVLHVRQPYANHNGGMIAFGPDGMLWIGMGDGGSAGDPHGNGQDRRSLLGKMLRLDVDRGTPYAIPEGNPYAGHSDARPEIWATGLRNPWRFAFDAGLVFIGDVGQDAWEEIDVQRADAAGLDYGWNLREGLHAFHRARAGADSASLVDPALEYGHREGCSVIGGVVYRGRSMPSLEGTYFFSDYCQGWLRSFRWRDGRAVELRQWTVGELGSVTSFGSDAKGEVYVTTQQGSVLRLDPLP